MGQTIPPRFMQGPPQRRPDTALQDAERILNEPLWSPVYEEGGVDALYRERPIPLPPPSAPDPLDKPSGRFRL